MAEMERIRTYCAQCGSDITRAMKFYEHKTTGWYCYDCWEAKQEAKRQRRQASKQRKAKSDRARALHRQGMKPSQIAEKTGLTTREVYEALSE